MNLQWFFGFIILISYLYYQIHEFLDNHDRHIHYENQAEKNKKNQKIIFEHTTQITHLLGFITSFQRKIVELYHQYNDQVFKFTSTKDLLLNKYSSMAKQYKKGISFRK